MQRKLSAMLGSGVLYGRVSIIMLQKVAATIKKVAADLRFMACEVR